MPKTGSEKSKKYFFVVEKLFTWAFLYFLTRTGLFTALCPNLCIKKSYHEAFDLIFLKSKKMSR